MIEVFSGKGHIEGAGRRKNMGDPFTRHAQTSTKWRGMPHRFDKRDVVRHPLVARIVEAYEQRTAAEKDTARRGDAVDRRASQGAEAETS